MAKEIAMCRASSSMSSVIGNVSYIVRDFLVGLFPSSFFKNIHIDTTMTALEFEKSDVFKKEKPILLIKPRISFDDNTIFGRLPDWMSTNYFVFKQLDTNYSPVFVDFDKGTYIYSVPDRLKITFEIDIICSTKMQQINVAQYLKSSVLHNGYFYLEDSNIETEVPKYFIKLLSKYMNFDMSVKEEKDKFMDYLDNHSQSFITEKIKASSGNPAYFYIYKTNLLCKFEDFPQVDDGEQKDMTDGNFRVTETFTVDFWCPSNFFLETNEKKPDNIEELDNEAKLEMLGADRIAMNYTMNFLPEKVIDHNGKRIDFLKKQGYITDKIVEQVDELDLSEFFAEDIKDVIAYNNKYRIDNDEVFKIEVYRENKRVNPKNVIILWDTLVLQNWHPDKDTTYHMFLYGDKEKIIRTVHRLQEINGQVYHDK